MLIRSILLSSLVAVAVSQRGRTAQDCAIGQKWTEKYIRFECYQGTGDVVKGVRAIGCVPKNNNVGDMIEVGATFNEQYFTYRCSKEGEAVSYQIINCRDTGGKLLAVDETRKMVDGTTLKCYKDASGAIKMSQDTPGGCLHNDVKYAAGKTWTHDLEFKAKHGGVLKAIGKGVRMECKKVGNGFVGKPLGCLTNSGKLLYHGNFAIDNGMNVKCLIAADGKVTMTVVDEKDVDCSYNGKPVKNGGNVTTGQDVYICRFGRMEKYGCVIDGKRYGNGLFYINGKAFHCNYGSGYVDFGNLTGCTMSDGTIRKFYSTWINGTEIHQCYYSVNGRGVSTYIYIWGCAWGKKQVWKNYVATNGDEVKKCALVNGKWQMRDLNTEEYSAYIKSKSIAGSSNVFGGAGGSGAGGDLRAVKTTTTTTEATTPERLADAPAPANDQPLPAVHGDCKDLLDTDSCAVLAPLCQAPKNSSAPNLEEIVKKTSVTAEQIKQILSLMGIETPQTSSEKEKDEVDEIVRSLVGGGPEGGCDSCQKRSCKKCQNFKTKLNELVKMVCSATCGSCNAAEKFPSILKAIVRFYELDCR